MAWKPIAYNVRSAPSFGSGSLPRGGRRDPEIRDHMDREVMQHELSATPAANCDGTDCSGLAFLASPPK